MRRSLIAISAVTLLVFPLSTQARADSVAESEATVTVERDSSVTLAEGAVTTPTGEPQAGVFVEARLWPQTGQFDESPGATFTPPVLVSDVTAKDGSYRLAGGKALGLSAKQLDQGVTVELAVFNGTEVTSHFTTLRSDPAAAKSVVLSTEVETGPSASVQVASAATSKSTDQSRSGLEMDFVLAAEDKSVAGPAMEVSPLRAPNNCSLVQNYGASKVLIAATHSTVSGGHTRKLSFSTSAASELGVASSATGAYGSFKASGTSGVSSSSGVSFPAFSNKGSANHSTYYTYGKYRCYYGVTPTTGYAVYPIAFAGGGTYTTGTNTIAVSSVNCAPIGNGVSVYKTSGRTLTWAGGVTLGGKIGINLTSKSTYSSSVRVDVKATSSGRGWCGQSGPAGSTNGAIQVK